ncbi:MAG TPA: cytochrome P450 [Gemmatimonadaceae bacterium]|nr:cytochrome P450 [Gemmatimonadaceae bacterium]
MDPLLATGVERTVEIALVGVIALPLARLAIHPGVRRRFQAFPRIQTVMTATLALYVVAVVIIALSDPIALRAAAAAALVVLALERWQARAAHGRKAGLPAGSLAVMPISPWHDPQFYLKQAARHGPVFKFRHFIHPAVGIVGLERAANFLAANDESLVVPAAPFNGLVPGGFVRYLDGGRHRDVAAVLRSALTPAVVDSCEQVLATEAKSMLLCLAANDGKADPLPAIDRMVLNDLMRCFFGISPGPDLDRLEEHYRVADYRHLARTGRRRAAAALFDIIGELRTRTLSRDEDSLADRQSFLSELCRLHPDALSDDELMANFVYTLHTARLDVIGFLSWLLVKLGENPASLARLANEIEFDRAQALAPGGLADRLVRETLRLHQSEFLLRRVKRPIRWDGLQIPAGWYVRICVQESHRSSEMFDSPDNFDPDRFLVPARRTQYSPFGLSPRICPGAHLSRAIGRNLAVELAAGYELEVHNAEPAEFSGFHWRPGSRFTVSLRPRA